MLMFCFFIAVFSSASWFIYAVMFINSKLADAHLWEQNSEQMLLTLAVLFVPVMIIWMVFGYTNQFLTNRSMNAKQSELLKQLQKNQDYTDLVVRVMLDAEHEIKDGFVINKFDLFISDMNESLSEIIQRCNIASSAQLEQLWQRVKRGERWVLGKAILDASKSQSTFDAWVREKVNRDKVFRGTLLEFCSRYQNLLQLLEKHDRDRIFLRIIETGVFGKVYSIIAPLSEGLNNLTVNPADKIQQSKPENDYSSVLKIATLEEPSATETIVNVDKNDDEDVEIHAPKRSIFSRIFGKKEEIEEDDEHEQDPFFKALHNSFQDSTPSLSAEKNEDVSFFENKTSSFDNETNSEPKFSLLSENEENLQPQISENRTAPTFGGTRSTLDSLRSSNDSLTAFNYDSGLKAEKNEEPKLGSVSEQVSSSVKKEEKEDDLAYPFGGWTDEENYR